MAIQVLIKGTVRKTCSTSTLNQNIFLYGSRIVIPQLMGKEAKSKIHSDHQDIIVADFAWWDGASQDMEKFV